MPTACSVSSEYRVLRWPTGDNSAARMRSTWPSVNMWCMQKEYSMKFCTFSILPTVPLMSTLSIEKWPSAVSAFQA